MEKRRKGGGGPWKTARIIQFSAVARSSVLWARFLHSLSLDEGIRHRRIVAREWTIGNQSSRCRGNQWDSALSARYRSREFRWVVGEGEWVRAPGSGLRVRACRASTPRPRPLTTANQPTQRLPSPPSPSPPPPPPPPIEKNYSPIPFVRYSTTPSNVLGLALKSSRPPQPVPSDRVRRPRCSQSSAPRQLSQCRPSLRHPEPAYDLPPRGARR